MWRKNADPYGLFRELLINLSKEPINRVNSVTK